MTSLQDVRRVVQARLDKFQPAQRSWDAYLGDGNGTINDESQPFHTYVRYPAANSPATSITNTRVPAQIENLRIKVGYLPEQPTLLQVLSVVPDQRLDDAGSLALLPTHAPTHAYGGSDPVYVVWRQIGDFRLYATGGLQVTLQGGIATIAGTVTTISTQLVDLTDSVPTTGARWSLISIDSTGAVNVTDGTPQTTATALTFAHIPSTPSGEWRIWAIKLQASQTVIDESRLFVDTLDLRWPQNVGAGSVALSDLAPGSAQYQYIVTGATPFTPVWSTGFLNIAAAKTLSATGTLTLTPSSDGLTATVPATGTIAIGAGTLTVASTNDVTGATHTHAVTSSSNPGAAASILASSASGGLQVTTLGVGTTPIATAKIQAAGNILTSWTDSNYGTWYQNGDDYRMGFNTITSSRTMNLHAYAADHSVAAGIVSISTGVVASPVVHAQFGDFGSRFTGAVSVIGEDIATDGIILTTTTYLNIPNPGTVAGVVLNQRGFGFAVDTVSVGSAFGPTFGIGVAVNRSTPACTFSNGSGPSLALNGELLFYGASSLQEREMMALTQSFIDNTDASRTTRTVWNQYDTAAREVMRGESSGSAPLIGFLGANAIARYSSTGDLRQALIDFGLYTTGGASPLDLNGGRLTGFVSSLASTTASASLKMPAGTAPTSPVEGDQWNDSTQKADIAFIDGIKQSRVGCIYSSYASVTVSNTLTETTLLGGSAIGTLTLPANFWTVGKTIKITAFGIHTTPGGSPTIQNKLKLGAVTVGDTGALVDKNDTNTEHDFIALITCRTTGATGTVYCVGRFLHHESTSGCDMFPFENTATSTVDTTAAMAIDLTVQFSTNTGISFSMTNVTIEVLN